MAYCPHCSAEVRSTDTFCYKCGRPLEISNDTATPGVGDNVTRYFGAPAVADAQLRKMDVIIDPVRILVLSILSFGTYLFYWYYLTWKHYRDYTKTENYPVWHSLTLFVPLYCLFRMHAHIRSFKELMAGAGMASSLSPNLGVAFVMLYGALGYASSGWSMFGNGFTPDPIVTQVLDIISVGIVTVMLVYLQNNLNRYWRSLKGIQPTNARIGVGEVLFTILGILAWIGTFLPETSQVVSG